MKTLAKSLHTVTVLVRVAASLAEDAMTPENFSNEDRLHEALRILGYPDEETLDLYGLVDKALEQLS